MVSLRAKRLRVDVDTSVIGGCLDEEFALASTRLIEETRSGHMLLVVSDITLAELAGAPQEVRSVIEALPRSCLEFV
jgi:hypothetical protein